MAKKQSKEEAWHTKKKQVQYSYLPQSSKGKYWTTTANYEPWYAIRFHLSAESKSYKIKISLDCVERRQQRVWDVW